jgi:hypothetical protein
VTPAAVRVPRVVILGGGGVGTVAVRQLLRAAVAGRLACDALVVVDQDPDCALSDHVLALTAKGGPPVHMELATWADWLDVRLANLAVEDRIVLHHLGPNLLLGWLERQVVREGGRLERLGPVPSRPWPFEVTTPSGDRALSYATWACPPLCIEPALCPHTRGPRDWSLAGDLAVPPAEADAALVFPSLHLAWGIGAVAVGRIHAARDQVLNGLRHGPRTYVVGTASHCHGVAARFRVAAGPS